MKEERMNWEHDFFEKSHPSLKNTIELLIKIYGLEKIEKELNIKHFNGVSK